MKAVRIDGQTPGGKRSLLANLLPLKTPFSIQIFPVYGCNLACAYCIHSLPASERGYVTGKAVMEYDLYQKCIDDLTQFPTRLKMLRFAGTGEPLLHRDLAKMIAYAAKKQVADSLDIVTNGLLLTPETSLALVEAGAHKIRISVQGLDDGAYSFVKKKGVFTEFLSNLQFLYAHRRQAKIYVKIIDCALKQGDDKRFFQLFGDLCDFIAIEHLIPAVDKIDYEQLAGHPVENITQNGSALGNAKVCPQPFYFMQVNPDGKVVPCCSMETPYIIGDVSQESMPEIWEGQRLRQFRVKQLAGQKEEYAVCRKCRQYQYAMFPEDVLDGKSEDLLKKF